MTPQQLARQLVALRDPMFRYARTLLLRQDEAEDAVSDVIERLVADPTRWAACSNLRALAMTAVRNRCLDLLRQREAGMRRAAQLAVWAERATRGEHERWEAREVVRRAMAELPERLREVLHLKEIEGFATREIAELLVTEEAQVRVWLSRARCRMRQAVEQIMKERRTIER